MPLKMEQKKYMKYDNIISNFKFNNYNFKKTFYERITVGKNNNSRIINPYLYFGYNDIWPRGFKLNDINKYNNNTFFNCINSN